MLPKSRISCDTYKQNGITLIALIITIIIMLILAGVTLNLMLGKHGIFKTAMEAGQEYQESEIKEEIRLAVLDIQGEEIANGNEITLEKINEKLSSKLNISTEISNNKIIGEYKGYNYEIDDKFNIEFTGEKSDKNKEILSIIKDTEKFKKYLENTENADYIINNANTFANTILENEEASDCMFENEYVCEEIFGGENINQNWMEKILKSDIAIQTLKKDGESPIKEATASSEHSSSYSASNMFDKNTLTTWHTKTGTLPEFIVFELDKAVAIYEFQVLNRSDSLCIDSGGHYEFVPLKFKIIGSNNNFQTEEILGEYTGKDENGNVNINYIKGEQNTYRIQNIHKKYKFYKLIVEETVSCQGNDSVPCGTGYVVHTTQAALAEISFFGK